MGTELWRAFEKRIKTEAPLFGITCWLVPPEMRLVHKNGQTIPVPIKSYPDFAAGIGGLSAFFDAKSTQSNSWNLQDYVFRSDSRANKLHQWITLEEAWSKGSIAGYLVWFVNLQMICWAPVDLIQECKRLGIKAIDPKTPGVVSLPDDQLIDLRKFMEKDLIIRRERIKEGT